MSPRVQAELSDGADKEQGRYRGYLLRRLLPALAAQVVEGFDAGDTAAGDALALAPRSAQQRLDACTTAQLERELTYFYHLLLQVRIAVLCGAGQRPHSAFARTLTGLVGGACEGICPLLVLWKRATGAGTAELHLSAALLILLDLLSS